MIKFSLKLSIFLFLVFSSVAQAGLIKADLTDNNYVTIGDLDWTWASPENSSWVGNTIYTPLSIIGLDGWDREGWRHATDAELLAFITNRDISLFSYEVGGEILYKNSFIYWNTTLTDVTSVDVDAFNAGQIHTYLVGDNAGSSWAEETFYVRGTTQVPEPSTIMIFAIALIALSMRKRAIN
jgi:hypothetical protein